MKICGKGHNNAVYKKALKEENGNGAGIRYESLRIISRVPPSSGIFKGPGAILEAKCER